MTSAPEPDYKPGAITIVEDLIAGDKGNDIFRGQNDGFSRRAAVLALVPRGGRPLAASDRKFGCATAQL